MTYYLARRRISQEELVQVLVAVQNQSAPHDLTS